MRSLRNLTITVEEEVAAWARVKAARENTSISRLVGDMLKERMSTEEGYEQAMRAYFEVAPRKLSSDGRYPSREALHGRPRIR